MDVKFKYKNMYHTIQCRPSDKISDLLLKFLRTVNNMKTLDNFLFVYRWRLTLNSPYMLSKTVREVIIRNMGIILVTENTEHALGETGFAAKFIDPEKEGPVEINTIVDGPKYLNGCSGLNLFGNCVWKECIAYNKEVNHQFGFGKYDVVNDIKSEKKRPICPMCKKSFVPTHAGFMNCSYIFHGKKVENNETRSVHYEKTTYGNAHADYFKLDLKNMGYWIELKITASPIKE